MPANNEYRHPYKQYEDSPLWKVVDKAIAELVENKDLQETTHHNLIVGYIVECLLRETDSPKGSEEVLDRP